jgi:hypothetical protein
MATIGHWTAIGYRDHRHTGGQFGCSFHPDNDHNQPVCAVDFPFQKRLTQTRLHFIVTLRGLDEQQVYA